MKFWEYNGNKVILIAVMSFFGGVLCSIFLARDMNIFQREAVVFSAVLCITATVVYTVRGLSYFRTMKRIMEDTSDLSILSLFDDGHAVILGNEHSRIFFTTERIKGDISGIPVVVSFSQGSRASWPSLVFSFYPLYHPTLGNRTSTYLSFKLNIRNRLKKDIKPEVLQFVKELKAKGYSSAEYSQFFVTAN